ncbi:ribosomal-processing cysteine protease Prp [Nosocomiicoccus massiliensis]|uniref:ribosomal-processing cysteine protease Prp n=1 Tax=Nosocomiicoccus massiliensis TaxID=1232430 RepID=UPI0004133E15|nr:ribosomal-processing cysteine protease Prp [Nosocomiicoccus massiliensis]
MVHVEVKLKDDVVKSIEMSGHADYGEHGQDIVCAGASSVVFGNTNAIFQLTDVEPVLDINNEGGYFFLEVKEYDQSVNLILKTMIISLETIEQSYKDYIKVTKSEVD